MSAVSRSVSREYASTLSANRVHIDVVDGRLEITFDGHESSWGEGLNEQDTLETMMVLMGALAEYHGRVKSDSTP